MMGALQIGITLGKLIMCYAFSEAIVAFGFVSEFSKETHSYK